MVIQDYPTRILGLPKASNKETPRLESIVWWFFSVVVNPVHEPCLRIFPRPANSGAKKFGVAPPRQSASIQTALSHPLKGVCSHDGGKKERSSGSLVRGRPGLESYRL